MLDPAIFRAYDIRGIAGQSLSEDAVYAIGQAAGSLALEKGDRTVSIGRDGRLSGPALSASLKAGLLSTGCDVVDTGVVPTPLLYYATRALNTHSGIMLTGSHNPPDYNGLKLMIAGKPLTSSDIQALYKRILARAFHCGMGESHETDIAPRYIRHVAHTLSLIHPLKIVIDGGNGPAGRIASDLFRSLGCDVTELFCEIDGHFPNHHPDPSDPRNLQDLIAAVRQSGADLGLAFDGDGDRLGVITGQGNIIHPDRLLMLFAQDILKTRPGATIIYDVKCSRHLADVIRQAGGVPLMWKTGHSFIKAKLAETQAPLAGEMSGHLFFRDRWYGFDDAIYAGARLLQLLAVSPAAAADPFQHLPDSINTPELKIAVPDHEKFNFMTQLADTARFGEADISAIDGLRVNFSDGWGLVRPSNTTPCLVLRFEADTPLILERIQSLFRKNLLAVNPHLVLPF